MNHKVFEEKCCPYPLNSWSELGPGNLQTRETCTVNAYLIIASWLAFRMIGIAQSKDLQGKPKAEKMCLNIGVLLTKGYCNITTTKDLLHTILETESKS